jgi:RNA polymerase sigma factor (TIGR02999 family)
LAPVASTARIATSASAFADPAMSPDPSPTVRLLQRVRDGETRAGEELFAALYDELRRIAAVQMQAEGAVHTLQPTALVHEAWVRLVGPSDTAAYADRTHFVRVAARAMRRVLVDHARRKRSEKRDAARAEVPLDQLVTHVEERAHDVLALDGALEKLSRVDAELARIVELRFFAGLSVEETARVLDASTPTVQRRWRAARAWLRSQMPASAGESTA